ncbi:hypothetical protein JL193_16885 [Polaribacter batillariae]|uniref:Uncharacterized protein n=1 Tax=Polaribacter batillariae TaxID=2808900 RepID=A0ABX7SWP9_9FLAO|nr:DUF6695 family protein [Polaribacter batillariae]QTD37710.1 hypothetical protein JL193_16885 [Polaribacter batillariae]
MHNSNGIIIILSYPDTVVRPAYWERLSGFWPKIGIGGKHAVQAGHAAFLLIKKEKPEINYFDFGRYITSYGNGRVRSKETDPELAIPIVARFKNNTLTNLSEILLWVENHPKKTHGDGRLVASINEDINFEKAKLFINQLIEKKEIPYGAFLKNGTNCARFVTDTIIAASNNKKITNQLKTSNLFTPSPIGNVIKGTTENIIYETYNQHITEYKNRSIIKEYKASFFNKFNHEPNLKGTEEPNLAAFNLKNGTWLGGIGSGAWFNIEEKVSNNTYKIARYTSEGIKDFESIFMIDNALFNHQKEYKFVHPTTCKEVFIEQNNHIFSSKIFSSTSTS